MKHYLVLLLLFFTSVLLAQNNLQDVVYLKNGSIIHGTIIEQVPEISIKIQTRDGNVFFYKMDEIEKITKEAAPEHSKVFFLRDSSKIRSFSYEQTKKRGYREIVEIGALFGVSQKTFVYTGTGSFPFHSAYMENFFSLQTIQGRQLNEKVFMGFGFGFDVASTTTASSYYGYYNYLNYYNYNGYSNNFNGYYFNTFNASQDFLIPLFLDVRGTFLKGRYSPYLEGKLGYSVYLPAPAATFINYEYTGGPLIGLNTGVRIFITNRIAFNFSLGYRMQNLVSHVEYQFTDENGNNLPPVYKWQPFYLHYLNLLAGISF